MVDFIFFKTLEELKFTRKLSSAATFHVQIHWFSIFNSFMMVIFLTGLVSMILMRTLRNDYAKYAREDDDLESLVSTEREASRLQSLVYSLW